MKYLSGKEKKQLQNQIPQGYEVSKKDEIKEKDNILFKGDEPFLIKIENKLMPHIKSLPNESYKSVYVDKGAIPFIAKGADLMRPGIQKVEHDFDQNEVIQIKDENLKKTIALGIAMYNSKELEKIEKGKVVQVYHYIGDAYY